MLAILLSFTVISFIFITFGDCIVYIYNKVCRKEERYSLLDTFLLGMVLSCILLSISSLFLPSNHYVLSAYILLCAGYWLIKRTQFRALLSRVKVLLTGIPKIFLLMILGAILSYIAIAIWSPGVFDAFFYHQQNIRWNEEFSVVPGLANLEDRFGFNSNYLLLSALFSFRVLFGEAIYGLQATIVMWAVIWILYEISRSRFETKRILLLFSFMLFFFIQAYSMLTTTSTDIVPNIVIFCFFAKFILYPKSLQNSSLYAILIPITLVTLKISVAPVLIISIFVLCHILKNKDYKSFMALAILSILTISPWLIRNVIISGYLLYPAHNIDLFAFDWKLPKEVAILQHGFVRDCGTVAVQGIVNSFSDIRTFMQPHTFLSNLVYIIILLSPISFINAIRKQKKEKTATILVYCTLIAIIAVWAINAPDPRFVSGVLYISACFAICLLLPTTRDLRLKPLFGQSIVFLFALVLTVWGIKRSYNFYADFGSKNTYEHKRQITDALIKPYSYKTQLTGAGIDTNAHKEYLLNNGITIYLSESEAGGRPVCFDCLPCTVEDTNWTSKYQDIKTIEARGSSLQDGFRPKTR